jgi:uncharacterized protein YnzC (UPF0291/DUF896 family)
MEQLRIDRINELARKSRTHGLSDEEMQEQRELRAEYVAAFRASLESTLENTYIVDEKGNKIKIKKKQQ